MSKKLIVVKVNEQEVIGYIEDRKVDEFNETVKVLQSLGYAKEESVLYVGEQFIHLSAVSEVRDATPEEVEVVKKKIQEMINSNNETITKLQLLSQNI